ncbi:MAG: substrate-binding domain-containing protein [Terriglobia bacterium]
MSENVLDERQPPKGRYRVGTLEKALSILHLLEHSRNPLRIHEIADATGIERGTVFRVLCTLERHRYVERSPDKKYRATSPRRLIRIGYAGPLSGNPFRRDVTASIQRAASELNLELLMLDNTEDDPEANLENARTLINAKVNLVMEFQPIDSIAHVLGGLFASAAIPLIAVETQIPGAVFFGGNNYSAGGMAGETLGKFSLRKWNGEFDYLLLIESPSRGPASQARLVGALDGVRRVLGNFPKDKIVHLDGHANKEASTAVVAKALRSLPPTSRLLISAFNDRTAVGALEALREAGQERNAGIVGQNATAESREEIYRNSGPLIASVAYFPERYGSRLMRLALAILNHEPPPPAVYTQHVVLDRHNIHVYYPQYSALDRKSPAGDVAS